MRALSILKRSLIVCFITLLHNTCANSNIAAEGACIDKQPWCEAMKTYCDYKDIVPMCLKTCDACPGPNPEESKHPTFRPGCDTMKCEQKCERGEGGMPTCSCERGFELKPDKKSCKDIDECKRGNPCNAANSECVNTEGSYKCEKICPKGQLQYYGRDGCCALTKEKCGKNFVNDGSASATEDEELAIVNRWPWMSLIYVRSTNKNCGGILVSNSWVIAAAHCFKNASADDVQASFGIMDTNEGSGTNMHFQKRRVREIVIHPNYDYPSYDVALIKLTREVEITKYVSPVCLPNNEIPPKGQRCWATGYAAIPHAGRVRRSLQQETLEITDRKRCASSAVELDRNMLCIAHGNKTSPRDCQGSTGGPLVCQRCSSCDWYVAGIASEGISCSLDKTITAFTSTSLHESWIRETMGLEKLHARTGASCQVSGKTSQQIVVWANWAPWSDCSASCGAGQTVRTRPCRNGSPGQDGCIGGSQETKKCDNSPCPGWQTWSEWSACSASCGGGISSRTQNCLGEKPGSSECRGSSRQLQKCNSQPCPKLTHLDKHSPCSGMCGKEKGTAKTPCVRGKIGDKGCKGQKTRKRPCTKPRCPDWSKWSDWSKCSHTCDDGLRTSTRECMLGNKASTGCKGNSTRTESCRERPCRVCSDWSTWSACNAICSGGTQERSRKCSATTNESELNLVRVCNTHRCVGSWTPWTDWTKCSTTCGGGVKTRERQCRGGRPSDCRGASRLEEDCNKIECPSVWSEWGYWEDCDAVCGSGTRRRIRNCQGDRCHGRPFENEACTVECASTVCSEVEDFVGFCERSAAWCNIQPQLLWGRCDKTCCMEEYKFAFSAWSSWSTCTTSCGNGEQIRRRDCNLPNSCARFNLNLAESRPCKAMSCNARLTTTCSASCGGGFTNRPCRGLECEGENRFVLEPCNTQECSGILSEWGEWGPCSSSCGLGMREKRRTCIGNKKNCDGKLVNTEECQITECIVEWSEWQDWGPCSTSCGLGTIIRNRTCLKGKCEGSSTQEEICLTFECPIVKSRCEDESTMVYLCPLVTQYCEDDYMKHVCRKTCGLC